MFRERKGRSFVDSRKYRLLVHGSGKLVTGTEWAQDIRSGQRVLMSALVLSAPNRCPNAKCQAQNTTAPTTGSTYSEIQWSVFESVCFQGICALIETRSASCNTWYKHLDEDPGLLDDDMTDRSSSEPTSLRTAACSVLRMHAGDDFGEDEDTSFVRRMITFSGFPPELPLPPANRERRGAMYRCNVCSKV